MNKNLQSLFKNKKLYELALTHKSWVNEHPKERTSNERLEFLGDAILEFIVSDEIFSLFPDKEEGYLTSLRANLVNTKNLSEIAKKLNIGQELFLSKGEVETGGRTNPSILANAFEAIIGALYLDQGLEETRKFIKNTVLSHLKERLEKPLKDSKSLLQEYVQSLSFPAPRYRVVSESGPDHDKRFVVEVLINSKSWGRGKGKNKQEAEQEAAKAALVNFVSKYSKNKVEKAKFLK